MTTLVHEEVGEHESVLTKNVENEEEPELTSLTWLTELRNQSLTWPNSLNINAEEDNEKIQSSSIGESLSDATVKIKNRKSTKSKAIDNSCANKNLVQQQQQQANQKRSTPADRYKIFLDKIRRDLKEYEHSAKSYQTDSSEKPPFNYSHIIGMAMLENGRITLQQICAWIEAKFAFFRVRKKWNNSIRHNLSLHHCFRKINRNKYEKGKGGYWELGIDPKKCDRKRIRNRKSSKTKLKTLNAANINITTELAEASDAQKHEEQQQVDFENPHNDQEESFFDYGEYSVAATLENGHQLSQLYVTETQEAPKYHLGTIIISTAAVSDTREGDLSSFDPRQMQFNSMSYNEEERSDYTDFPAGYDVLERMQQTDMVHQRRNVIVEQVFSNTPISNISCESECSPGVANTNENFTSATSSVLTVPITATIPAITEPNSSYFTPYIDGIEEAFQYLRSIDQSNREDILDNILDISVSDY